MLRYIYLESKNPYIKRDHPLDYELKKDFRGKSRHGHVVTNQFAERITPELDEEWSKRPELGVFLGDSVTFGFAQPAEQTFVSLLNQQSTRRYFVNLAVPGYGIKNILARYQTSRHVSQKSLV